MSKLLVRIASILSNVGFHVVIFCFISLIISIFEENKQRMRKFYWRNPSKYDLSCAVGVGEKANLICFDGMTALRGGISSMFSCSSNNAREKTESSSPLICCANFC
jgi:hypothetical protein